MPDTEPVTISLFGVAIPVARWSTSAFAIVAVVFLLVIGYQRVFPAEPELVNLQQANHAMSVTMSEYGRHLGESPAETAELYDDARGRLTVSVFEDGCLLVSRKSPLGAKARLLPDLLREDLQEHKSGDEMRPRAEFSLLPSLSAQGRCLNPHPPNPGRVPFEERYEKTPEQCVVKIWRRWSDGCEHFQLFNPCNGSVDVNADGSPRVTWVKCVH